MILKGILFLLIDGHRPQCLYDKCAKGSTASNKKYYSSAFNMFSGVQNIQKEIMAHGPVQTEFYVYSDFLNYKGGIYKHITGPRLGFYSAKIVGWGVEKDTNTPYWVAASVFGKDWGENGYFRIVRGSNECNFEGQAVAGTPDTSRE